jgi:uncharacterized protein (UPF0335 family)
MGRPPGSRNKPREASIGDNSAVKELTPEQNRSLLMQACDRIGQMKDEIATMNSRMRHVYKEFKADGLPKKDIDLALEFHKMDEEEAIAWASSRAQIMEWVHPGVQAELDFSQAAE